MVTNCRRGSTKEKPTKEAHHYGGRSNQCEGRTDLDGTAYENRIVAGRIGQTRVDFAATFTSTTVDVGPEHRCDVVRTVVRTAGFDRRFVVAVRYLFTQGSTLGCRAGGEHGEKIVTLSGSSLGIRFTVVIATGARRQNDRDDEQHWC